MEHVLGRVRRSKDDLSKLCNSEELMLTMHYLSSESARTNLAVSFCFIEHGSISGRHFVFCCFCFAKFLANADGDQTTRFSSRISASIRTLFTTRRFCITFEKGGGSWESFLRTILLYYRDKFIEKINFAFHNFFHLVEYNKYTYRRDITMSIYVNVGNIR